MIVIAIDPGSSESAWLQFESGKILRFAKEDNKIVLGRCNIWDCLTGHLAIEYMYPRGMPTSKEEMDTQFWAGRFVQSWNGDWSKVYRKDVKMHLCGSMRAKDSNIRQAILDRFPATGGGKTPQVGTKKQPGPLFGIKADIWSALAIALTFSEMRETATEQPHVEITVTQLNGA